MRVKHCQLCYIITVSVCEGNPCKNSAKCVENDDGTFTCKCQQNYEGILCEKKGKACEYFETCIYESNFMRFSVAYIIYLFTLS